MRKIHENLSKMSAVNLALHRIKAKGKPGDVGTDRSGRSWCFFLLYAKKKKDKPLHKKDKKLQNKY